MTRYGYFDEKELASRDGAKSPFEKEVRDELVDKLNHLLDVPNSLPSVFQSVDFVSCEKCHSGDTTPHTSLHFFTE